MKTKESQLGQASLRFIRSIAVNRAQTKHSARNRMLANSHAGRGTRLPSTWKLARPLNTSAFTGTDRGLLRSVLGPWSPVPKCEAPGAPISVEEHTSMVPGPRRQSQNPPLQKSSAIPALPWPSKPRLRYSPGLAPTTRLNALLNAASDS